MTNRTGSRFRVPRGSGSSETAWRSTGIPPEFHPVFTRIPPGFQCRFQSQLINNKGIDHRTAHLGEKEDIYGEKASS